jgi:hypothetical protein
MRALTKKEIKTSIGGLGVFYKQIWSPYIRYISGCENVDDAIRAKDVLGNVTPIIRQAKRGIWVSLSVGSLKSCLIGIPYDSIKHVGYLDLGNKKTDHSSVAASAIVGAAIAGPLGAAIGTLNSMALSEGGVLLHVDYDVSGNSDAFLVYVPIALKKTTDKFFSILKEKFDKIPV